MAAPQQSRRIVVAGTGVAGAAHAQAAGLERSRGPVPSAAPACILSVAAALMLAVPARGALAAPVPAQPHLDPAALSLDRVQVQEVPTQAARGKTFLAGALVAAPIAKVCAIIQDYAAYPSFMPNVGRTEILKTTPDSATVNMILDLPLGQTKRYRLQLEPTITTNPPACHLAWKQVPWEGVAPSDSIADTTGYWHLTPLPTDPQKTVAEYYVYADPGHVPFGFGWIVDAMSKRSLPKTLEAVRARAAQQP